MEEPKVPHVGAEVRPMSEAEKAALGRRFPAGSAVPLLLSGTRLLGNLTACLLTGGPDDSCKHSLGVIKDQSKKP